MSTTALQQFVANLKSRHEHVRYKAVNDLSLYVKSELREATADEINNFLDEFNHHIFEMVNSNDVNEKKGGILAIVCLIGTDVGNMTSRISRFANYLRNLLPNNDVGIMELVAKAMGHLAFVSGSKASEYVEFEVKRAFEWLQKDKTDSKRHAAVLVLKELAITMPTYFYQQVSQFFELITNAIQDPKVAIREGAVEALRAALVVTAQREVGKVTWYKLCYEESGTLLLADKGERIRDESVHAFLLIQNELLRLANASWERKYTSLLEKTEMRRSNDQETFNFNRPLFMYPTPNKKSANYQILAAIQPEKPIIIESSACHQLILEKFPYLCIDVMQQKFSRYTYVQQTLLNILPRLAAFDRKDFVEKHLPGAMTYLFNMLKSRDKERNMAFIAVGLIAVAVEEDIEPYVDKIMDLIKGALPRSEMTLKKRPNIDPCVFKCITFLALSLNSHDKMDIPIILEQMLATGLSSSLTICLRELAKSVPAHKEKISLGLLKMLSQILLNKPLIHPGTPRHLTTNLMPLTGSYDSYDTQIIVLALHTLGTFDFEGQRLLPFVQRCANHFLVHEQTEIRLEAVKTTCRLLRHAIRSTTKNPSETVTKTVASVLNRLLSVGLIDMEATVRRGVLMSLDPTFDHHLAQAESLGALFIALQDEVFEIREVALFTIGRLSCMNPAYVMPSLRKVLVQLLTELEHSGIGRNKEQGARMLDHLVVSAPRLIRPYMEPILKVLVPKLKESEPNPGVILSVLLTIGDLAEVTGGDSELQQWMHELMQILLDILGDSSSPDKRSAALCTLGQLVGATGHLVNPYNQYPMLLDVLINFLKTEQQSSIRRETIRVLGLLGALDPYKHKINRGQIDYQPEAPMLIAMSDKAVGETEGDFGLNSSEMLVSMSSHTLEEYYLAMAIATLMKIIRDPALSQHHTMVVQAVTFTFKSLGIKCVPYISQVLPSLLNVVRTADVKFRDFLFQQLAELVAIVKQHIRNYLDDICDLIKEFWIPNSSIQSTIILLLEHIAVALGAEFKVYLPRLVPQILRVLNHDTSKDKQYTLKLLEAMHKFGNNLEDYMHLLLPPIVRLFDAPDCPLAVQKQALETIDQLAEILDFSDFISRILHPLMRTIDNCPDLRSTAIECLCTLVMQLGRKFCIFIPMVQKVLNKHRIQNRKLEILFSKIQTDTTMSDETDLGIRRSKGRNKGRDDAPVGNDSAISQRLKVSVKNLQQAWTPSRRVSKDDWLEWLRCLSLELLKQSPIPALRSCLPLAQTYSQLPKDLFNAAFVSCWTELSEDKQKSLMNGLELALAVPDVPEITQTILNLAEFMEHCDKGPLPLDPHLLGEHAMLCRAYAKALHYKEEEFQRNGGNNDHVVESLISINNKLQQKEAAEGLLQYVLHRSGDVQVKVGWYEKLHNWDKALGMYKEKLEVDGTDQELCLGQMRCLEALGEWSGLHDFVETKYNILTDNFKNKACRLAAASAFGLHNWGSLEHYVKVIPQDSQDGAFYRAILAIHNEQYRVAQDYIYTARDMLDKELTAMAGESYQRAYGAMVQVQILSELEEVMQYKLVPERRPTIKALWWQRLQAGQRLVEDWQRIIQVHSLVLEPYEDIHTWLKYAALCRKNGSVRLSHKTLVMLLGYDPEENPQLQLPVTCPHVTFAYTKHLWAIEQKQRAFNQLELFLNDQAQHPSESNMTHEERQALLARCYLKLGTWQEALEGLTERSVPTILACYQKATEYDKDWYKAWHNWAYMNFEAVLFYKNVEDTEKSKGDRSNSDPDRFDSNKHTVLAVQGFFKSIHLSQGSSLQDTLRLLTLWFDYGQTAQVSEAIAEGIRLVEKNTWLQVIPQLIARIDTNRLLVSKLINHLLVDIGKTHPQALVYPLTVATKSNSSVRRTAANKILKSMSEHSPTLVRQALMASEELIRVAILWHEIWHEGLEEASRLYFGERNVEGMLRILEPLHTMMHRGAETLKETSFTQAYGRDLGEAYEWCQKYRISGNIRDLNQAWDLYYHVFRRISRQLPQLTSLELQYVSPNLLVCQDLELAVPGSYSPGQNIVRIAYFNKSLEVITSKQRPRKLVIRGSNGKDYMFLLKGHEDLRQDERVMQLFGLVNTLLLKDPDTFRRNLTIQRYAVIPLSTNSGLIGWVPHCDTLHTLIREYRDKKKILLNIEHRIMLRMAADYDHLTVMQKVEVFEHALEHTHGDDLAKLLWLKSPSSEVWFDRRTNYTRSLAVMSIVGYILGLGDRHPSNLMLDRLSGKILHIDFGDCFEVAMTREKFPEKIPFRLTRMLINAMEVTGIDGTYRRTCESVMSVLHRNKDSLMAVLEAFVYDPLLNWRLMDTTMRNKSTTGEIGSFSTGTSQDQDLVESLSMTINKKNLLADVLSEGSQPEGVNKKAVAIINRVRDKLTGNDFSAEESLTIEKQVDLLIQQATSNENLCQCYIGWCPFW
ncbi:serine/threonine-protein kinase Tor [Diabrotica virgifera virgifera]|uniref:Serine/threonine-protein kinase TOR n=1 Tax=Diabrotica virgifera virgifera TaxID=50390 RepID=A0ABM5KLE0_DIAVI|nr:serine/threonine-protein kinase Tor [Diabrotica virgifera virgifera]